MEDRCCGALGPTGHESGGPGTWMVQGYPDVLEHLCCPEGSTAERTGDLAVGTRWARGDLYTNNQNEQIAPGDSRGVHEDTSHPNLGAGPGKRNQN